MKKYFTKNSTKDWGFCQTEIVIFNWTEGYLRGKMSSDRVKSRWQQGRRGTQYKNGIGSRIMKRSIIQ